MSPLACWLSTALIPRRGLLDEANSATSYPAILFGRSIGLDKTSNRNDENLQLVRSIDRIKSSREDFNE